MEKSYLNNNKINAILAVNIYATAERFVAIGKELKSSQMPEHSLATLEALDS